MTRPVSLFLLVWAVLAFGTGAQMPAPSGAPAPAPAAGSSPPALPAQSATPALGRLRIFEDWAVGCDNRLSCSAVSLLPAGAGDAYSVLVLIGREGGPAGQSTIEFSGANELRGKIDLFVDNEAVGQLVAARNVARSVGDNAFKLIRRLGSSYAFDLRAGKTSIAAPSLSGLAQALRYMDEQQGRIGSKAALSAVGDGPADQARPLPDVVSLLTAAAGPVSTGPVTLSSSEEQAVRALAKCGGRPRADLPITLHPLDKDDVLALVACDAGADNVSSIVLVGTGEPGARSFQYARFDLVPGYAGEPGTLPLIVNAQWNPVRGTLSSFARGRPLGDCGTSETYVWDGAMFRLTQARAMPVCRGAWEWPVLWSATPIEASANPAQARSSMPPARR